jgi:uncharacterized membrane protein
MHHSRRLFAVAMGGAMLIALSMISTEADAARKKSAGRSAVTSGQIQPPSAHRSSYGYQIPQGGYDRYSMPPGGGINFNDGRLGANWTGGAP